MKRFIIVVVVLLILIGSYLWLLSLGSDTTPAKSSSSINTNSYTYFWSETCPHCKNVAAFLENWPNKDKVSIDKKEISKDRANANLLTEKSAECNIPADQAGVPLLITPENKCLSGDQPIIDYFKNLFPESTPSATVSVSPKANQ